MGLIPLRADPTGAIKRELFHTKYMRAVSYKMKWTVFLFFYCIVYCCIGLKLSTTVSNALL